jgi:hypothetical protein
LLKYSSVDFKESNLGLLKFDEETAGLREEKILLAVYQIRNISLDSLEKLLPALDYKKLPASELELGNGFGGNITISDSGYNKLTLIHGAMSELVIVSMTQKKVIYYKILS